MQVVVVTPPARVLVLDLLKRHLRVDGDDDDLLIQAYADAAQSHIDGPDGWLGRSIGVQTLEARRSGFGCDLIVLPCGPVTSIVSVLYDDPDGVEQTLAPSAYVADPRGLLRAGDDPWPSARLAHASVRIRYTAGYAITPPAIKAALMLMAGDLYANRETGVVGTVSVDVKMSTTVENLLAPYRVWTV